MQSDNEYYKALVGSPFLEEGPEYVQAKVFPSKRFQWMRADQDPSIVRNFMTNVDMALIRDFAVGDHLQDNGLVTCSMFHLPVASRCPVAETLTKAGVFRNNNLEWLEDFRAALVAMVEKGLN